MGHRMLLRLGLPDFPGSRADREADRLRKSRRSISTRGGAWWGCRGSVVFGIDRGDGQCGRRTGGFDLLDCCGGLRDHGGGGGADLILPDGGEDVIDGIVANGVAESLDIAVGGILDELFPSQAAIEGVAFISGHPPAVS